jgi:secondary thiamine-phosphate synthase enzyme
MDMIEIETERRMEIIDITDRVEHALLESTLREGESGAGLCLVFSLHTTAGLIVNEADGALIDDILDLLEKIVPKGAGYLHDRGDGNAHAHLQATLLGNSVIVPVKGRSLALGTWQRILFVELDGPRKRNVFIQLIGR